MTNNDPLPTREEIEDERDIGLLYEWHEDVLDVLDHIKAQIAAWKLTGEVDPSPDWALRVQSKAGFAGATLKRIERRLITLGAELPLTVEREEREMILKLRHAVKLLRHKCEEAGIDVSHIK